MFKRLTCGLLKPSFSMQAQGPSLRFFLAKNYPAATTIATLPQELIDNIIDFLHSDTKSLLACRLVCSAWVSAAGHHIFRCPSLIDYRFRRSHKSNSPRSFIELLQCPTNTIGQHIRGFSLAVASGELLNDLIAVLSEFPINRITIHLTPHGCMPQILLEIPHIFPNVTQLGLYAILRLSITDQIVQYAFTFPLLRHLSINLHGQGPFEAVLSELSSAVLRNLQYLSLELNAWDECVWGLDWLRLVGWPSRLDTLKIVFNQSGGSHGPGWRRPAITSSGLNEWLEVTRDTLSCLIVTFEPYDPDQKPRMSLLMLTPAVS